ncbi:S-adenosyl-L-methionine-dependent methyltransferase, partial [Backusella circina FSU 941]
FDNRTPYVDIDRNNEKFKAYYKAQNILPEDEFDVFYEFIKTILPSTFRITGSRNVAEEILKVIETNYIPHLQNIVIDGNKIEPPQPLAWYPDQFGWKVNAPRLVLKKSPELSKFHKFIVTETEAGNLSRQEAVSMIPPLLMDIQPHQWVLDMCAAPGSKTAQIIEAVHANDKLNEMPVGLVVANDADYKRSHMLVHQSKRLQSPCFMATNHDGAHFPNIHVPSQDDIPGAKTLPWQFDRVLCDVPCSGDGTIRKNEKIWNNWSPASALQLHPTQVQIFARGCQLVKLGGRIVYSTCSFNPIENEAVVAEVLRQTKGTIELMDVSSELPALKRKPGLKTWKVTDKDGVILNSLDDITEPRQRRKFPASTFPPTPEEADAMHLERCLRIYPHDQDTGGFFVAVFKKVKPLTVADRVMLAKQEGKEVNADDIKEAEDESNDMEQEDNNKPFAGKPKRDVPGIKEAPFEMLPSDSDDLKDITQFYGLDAAFPRDQFLLRSEGSAKGRSLYFVSSSIKRVLEAKDFARLQTVNTGVRLFVRQSSAIDNGSPFRLTSEGLPLLDTVMSERRRIHVSINELRTLLVIAFPTLDNFPEEIRKKVESMEQGCCIVQVEGETQLEDAAVILPLSLPVWRGKNSLSVLLNKKDKRALCQRIFGEIPESTPEHLLQKSTENQLKQQQELIEKEQKQQQEEQ